MTNAKRSAALAPPVADAIAAFSPKMASAELWAEHGRLVIARVELIAPHGPESARRLLSAGVGLLAWAQRNHVPLRGEVLFSDETIERYIASVEAGAGPRSTLRGRLRRLRDAGKPKRIPEISRRGIQPPYTTEELVGLWRMVSNQPTLDRSRRLKALYCLGFGAGCDSVDLRHVFGTSIRADGDVVLVEVGGPKARTVPALAGVGEVLISLAEEAGQGLMIGGDPNSRQVVNNLIARASGGEDLPHLNAYRLRHSWMVALMSAPVPLADLARLAGVTSLRTFEELRPYCTAALSPAEVAAALEVTWL